MSVTVTINGRNVCSSTADGTSTAASPDVCWTPPSSPSGPVSVPYATTASAENLTNGSKTVTANSGAIALQNVSYITTVSGDDAATDGQGMGTVSGSIEGEAYFSSWSATVLVEGQGVACHLDLMTHNHACVPGNTPDWPYLDANSAGGASKCEEEKKKKDEACKDKGLDTKEERCGDEDCKKAMRCELQPFSKTKEKGCCDGQTPHHIVEVHCFTEQGKRKEGVRLPEFKKYDDKKAPCVCCDTSSRGSGDHGSMHAIQNSIELQSMDLAGPRSQMGGTQDQWTYGRARDAGCAAHEKTFPASGCSKECIAAQLDAYHNQIDVKDDTPVRADKSPLNDDQRELAKEPTKEFMMKRPRTDGPDFSGGLTKKPNLGGGM